MSSAADKVIYRIRIHTGECEECEDTDVSVKIVGENGSFKFYPRKSHAVDGSVSLFLSQSVQCNWCSFILKCVTDERILLLGECF